MQKKTERKLKILGIYCGVTVAVVLVFRYLLPLVAPFVIAWLIAAFINKPVAFLNRKLHIKRAFGATVSLTVILGISAVGIFFAGRALYGQVVQFASNFELYKEQFETWSCDYCHNIDAQFHLEDGTAYAFLQARSEQVSQSLLDSAGESFMDQSAHFISAAAVFFTVTTVMIMAVIFMSKDLEKFRAVMKQSVFQEELLFLNGHLKTVLWTYFRTQLIIMSIVCVIVSAGLYLMGNPYAFLLGVLIGFVDALPILGTGTVFIPWSIVLILTRNYQTAAWILILYLISYGVRQFLEPKLMGNRLGISPVLMLVSVYLGLLIFGISGVITGPIAAILIKETAGVLCRKCL